MPRTTIFRNGSVYDAYFKQFRRADVRVEDGIIAAVIDREDEGATNDIAIEASSNDATTGTSSNDASTGTFSNDATIVDITGKYIVPGLVDCHMHVESSMLTPVAFSEAVLSHGVTTLIAEPHEIANVFGLEGIEVMLRNSDRCDVDIRLAIPSSVPSTSAALETTGGQITTEEVAQLLTHPKTICLGEIMNCKELITDPKSRTRAIVDLVRTMRPDLPIEGHCPAFMGEELAAIIRHGVTADHTEQTPERIEARVRNGMFVQLQAKTLRPENVNFVKEHNLFEHIAIVTDDTMPQKLAAEGQLDVLLRKAIALGFTPEQAIYVCTYTPARRMRLYDRGAIAPGLRADFTIVDDIQNFSIEATYCEGRCCYDRNRHASEIKSLQGSVYGADFPEGYRHSVHVEAVVEDDFTVKVERAEGTVRCPLMKVSDGTTFIEWDYITLSVRNHEIQWEDSPYALACVFERHGKNGNRGYAFVGGNVLTDGAAATTYAHDHHNLLIVGQNKADMMTAANEVIGTQGGYAVAHKGQILASVALPIAGILYDGPVSELGPKMATIEDALHELGYRHKNVIMALSTLGLPVSPYLKVTDKGLVDVRRQKIVKLYEWV